MLLLIIAVALVTVVTLIFLLIRALNETREPFQSEDEAPNGKEPSLLILVLEIICRFAILLAIITTIIAWRVYTIRTGGY